VALHAPELDLDRAQSLLLASLGDIPLEWPRAGTLAIDNGRGTVGGVEANDIAVRCRATAAASTIERLAIGDIGGAKLTVGGRIDMREARHAAALRSTSTRAASTAWRL